MENISRASFDSITCSFVHHRCCMTRLKRMRTQQNTKKVKALIIYGSPFYEIVAWHRKHPSPWARHHTSCIISKASIRTDLIITTNKTQIYGNISYSQQNKTYMNLYCCRYTVSSLSTAVPVEFQTQQARSQQDHLQFLDWIWCVRGIIKSYGKTFFFSSYKHGHSGEHTQWIFHRLRCRGRNSKSSNENVVRSSQVRNATATTHKLSLLHCRPTPQILPLIKFLVHLNMNN